MVKVTSNKFIAE